MPHYRCYDCRVRLKAAHPPTEAVCPQCGSSLDTVVDVTELIGLRRIMFAAEPELEDNDFTDCFGDPPVAIAMTRQDAQHRR